ncbi:MAG: glycosyltransferase family 4 protein [Chloroflexota bacterium]
MAVRIAIDARLVDYQQAGIAAYTRNLLNTVPFLEPDWQFTVLRSRKRKGRLAVAPNLGERTVWTPPHNRWEQLVLPVETWLARPQLVHSPDFVPCFHRAWRSVITVHDLSFIRYPEVMTADSHRYYGQVARACASADRIIAVSQNTANDLTELLSVPEERVRIVHEAANPMYQPLEDPEAIRQVRTLFGVEQEYLLFVSTIEPRKNLETLLRAMARLKSAAGDRPAVRSFTLLVVGRPGWLYEGTMRLVKELHLTDRVRFMGGATMEELLLLYNGAVALVYPSLYEGFGLPPLEAMACGTPVLCANTSSLPEVVGDGGLLLPPKDVDAWAQGLLRVLEDESLRDDLRQRGLQRARLFSWHKAAKETVGVYREALGAAR